MKVQKKSSKDKASKCQPLIDLISIFQVIRRVLFVVKAIPLDIGMGRT